MLHLADVELQLILQVLDVRARIIAARVCKRINKLAHTAFSWKFMPDLHIYLRKKGFSHTPTLIPHHPLQRICNGSSSWSEFIPIRVHVGFGSGSQAQCIQSLANIAQLRGLYFSRYFCIGRFSEVVTAILMSSAVKDKLEVLYVWVSLDSFENVYEALSNLKCLRELNCEGVPVVFFHRLFTTLPALVRIRMVAYIDDVQAFISGIECDDFSSSNNATSFFAICEAAHQSVYFAFVLNETIASSSALFCRIQSMHLTGSSTVEALLPCIHTLPTLDMLFIFQYKECPITTSAEETQLLQRLLQMRPGLSIVFCADSTGPMGTRRTGMSINLDDPLTHSKLLQLTAILGPQTCVVTANEWNQIDRTNSDNCRARLGCT